MTTQIQVTNKILADVLHDLNPTRTREEWEDHIAKTGHDPKAFFGSNGEGLAEYEAFVRMFDKEAFKKALKLKNRRK